MTSSKEKNSLPYIIAIACFLVLFILMKAQDVRTEEARITAKDSVKGSTKESVNKRQTASARDSELKKPKN